MRILKNITCYENTICTHFHDYAGLQTSLNTQAYPHVFLVSLYMYTSDGCYRNRPGPVTPFISRWSVCLTSIPGFTSTTHVHVHCSS